MPFVSASAELGNSLLQLCLSLFISGLAEEREHIFLVRFNAGLVEGVYTEQVTGNGASFLEEIYEIAEIVCASGIKLEHDIRNAAVGMREHRTEESLLIYGIYGFAREEAEPVGIVLVGGNDEAVLIIDIDDRFKHHSLALLNELTDGVKVCGICRGGGINALAVLALALAEELLPPFAGHSECGVVHRKNFNALCASVFASAIEQIANGCIFEAVVGFKVLARKIGISLCRTGKHLIYIRARNGDGKQTYRTEHGISAADIVVYNKAVIAEFVYLRAERALCLIRGNKDSVFDSVLAVFLYEQVAEYAESYRRLCSRAGF